MCFISFGSIIGPIDVSDGTIFDMYLFSDCLNEILLFFSKPFQERNCIWVEQILKVWKKIIEAHRSASRKSFFVYIFGKGSHSKVFSVTPPVLFLLLEHMAAIGWFWFEIIHFHFLFQFFNKNILKHCLNLILLETFWQAMSEEEK